MSDWEFAQANPEQQLARLHHFSMCTKQESGDVEFTITVKEFLTPKDPAMGFFAQADKQTNQGVAPYTPVGWGKTMLAALAQCMREVERFPYRP
jgi:predicted ATPase